MKKKTTKKKTKKTEPIKPRVLIFRLSEIPGAEDKAKAGGVSERIRRHPFYVYDSRFARSKLKVDSRLPAEPKYPKAEDNRGYAFLDDLIQQFIDENEIDTILIPKRDGYAWYKGWHNSATVEQLTKAFEAGGFEIRTPLDLFASPEPEVVKETRNLEEALRFPLAVEILDLSSNEALTTLPDTIGTLANLKTLDVSFTSLKALPKVVAGLKSLRTLKLNFTKLRQLPDWIAKLPALRRLEVSSLDMPDLPPVIGELDLEQLRVHLGSFSPADAARIARNRRLVKLELGLRRFSLAKLPPRLWALPKLQELELEIWNGKLADVGGVERLTGLRQLTLKVTGARALPAGITRLTKLEKLELQMPNLEALPADLGKLRMLREIAIRGTPLTALPESIGALAKLALLSLHEVNVSALPASLAKLAALETLTIGHAPLAALPADIDRLRSLRHLDLNDCPLAVLPVGLWKLPKLERLDLRTTKVTAISPAISRLRTLETLTLWGSPVEALPPEFGKLPALRYIDIADTRIASLPDSIGKLAELYAVTANGAPLRELPAALARCSKLGSLSLTGCTFSRDGMRGLEKLRQALERLRVDVPRVEGVAAAQQKKATLRAAAAGTRATEISPAVLSQLARLGVKVPDHRGEARAETFPRGEVAVPEPLRRFYYDVDWYQVQRAGTKFKGTIDENAVTDLSIGDNADDLSEYECIHHKPFLPLAITLEFLQHYMIDLDDPDPTDPKVYGVGPAAFRETKPAVRFKRLSGFLAALTV